jgi:hypothetical protein
MKTSQLAEVISQGELPMRSNQNPSGSITRSVGDRNVGTPAAVQQSAGHRGVVAKLSMPRMPVEWLDSGSWRLPSGKALAEFALQAGFLAPLMFRSDVFGKSDGFGKSAARGSSQPPEVNGNALHGRGKHAGKGDVR